MSFRHEPRRPDSTLLVVADRGQARLFSAPWPELEPLTELSGMVHPEGRLREHDTVSDRAGRFRTPSGQRTGAEQATDFRHQTAQEFAREVCERLEAARLQNEFGRLVLVAPALFLGELRQQRSPELKKLTVAEVNLDLVHASVETIGSRVVEAFQSVDVNE
ncbi:MAG: host attachment protein [Planctomycetaceae bacterium]|nr:host attachment protein [Planctomycetaceae bacterium]